eukprot:XP_001702103.1 predicted protein [Chlamydomonas reinhardtii]
MARRTYANAAWLLVAVLACGVVATRAQYCTALYAPVCDVKTGTTYPNLCTALNSGLTKDRLKDGECADPCVCPLYLTPICDTHGRSWGNPCLARCGGIPAGAWRPGPCDSPKRFVGGVEDVTANNYCPHLTLPGGQQPGPCSAVWVDPATRQPVTCVSGGSGATALSATTASTDAAEAPCTCPLDRNPVCVNRLTYPSLCMAKCAGAVPKDATSGWKLGVCGPQNPFPTCPGNPNTPPVPRCLWPCSSGPCTADPSAICVPNPCGTLLTYRGYKVGACDAVWIDSKGAVVDACMPQPDDIYSCNAGSPQFFCTVENSNACDTATCPGAPASAQCLVKTCNLTYRNQLLPACAPIFYDPATGDVYNCGA